MKENIQVGNNSNLPEIYTVKQICDYLNVSENTLYSWIQAGKLQAAKIGRHWYITRAEVERILKEGITI